MENKTDGTLSYYEIIKEVNGHLNSQKELILKRAFLLSSPGLLLVLIYSLFSSIQSIQDSLIIYPFLETLGMILIGFVVIYTLTVSHILGIEKYIWIDSHFDKIDLNPKESLTIAKRLFWQSFKFRIALFSRYYFFPLVVYFVALFWGIYLPTKLDMTYNAYLFVLAFVIVVPILVYFSFYYLKTKLRYFWFFFLIILEMRTLYEIAIREA